MGYLTKIHGCLTMKIMGQKILDVGPYTNHEITINNLLLTGFSRDLAGALADNLKLSSPLTTPSASR